MAFDKDTITVNAVARRNALGGIGYRTQEISSSEREAVMTALYGQPGAPNSTDTLNLKFPAAGIYTLEISIVGFRELTDGEATLLRVEKGDR